jgi:hypothetical protein
MTIRPREKAGMLGSVSRQVGSLRLHQLASPGLQDKQAVDFCQFPASVRTRSRRCERKEMMEALVGTGSQVWRD